METKVETGSSIVFAPLRRREWDAESLDTRLDHHGDYWIAHLPSGGRDIVLVCPYQIGPKLLHRHWVSRSDWNIGSQGEVHGDYTLRMANHPEGNWCSFVGRILDGEWTVASVAFAEATYGDE